MTMLRRALSAGAVVVVLACVPSPLSAAQKETPTAVRPSALAKLSSLWSELAGWFTSEVAPPLRPGSGGGPTTDSGCTWDPWGGCLKG
jgi:hypothetical protein